jgi:hypothetical protein
MVVDVALSHLSRRCNTLRISAKKKRKASGNTYQNFSFVERWLLIELIDWGATGSLFETEHILSARFTIQNHKNGLNNILYRAVRQHCCAKSKKNITASVHARWASKKKKNIYTIALIIYIEHIWTYLCDEFHVSSTFWVSG